MKSSSQGPASNEQDSGGDNVEDTAASGQTPPDSASNTPSSFIDKTSIGSGGAPPPRKRPGDIPKEFGRYRIEKELGRGGMGVVYLAHDTQLDRKVALKIPFFNDDDDGSAVERFHREARAMATVQHANLCPVYDVGHFEHWHFLTMAYIDGQPLSRKLKKGGPLSVAQAARLLRTVALAVQKAHDAGIVHRDLKPANIMLTSQFEPIIMDFGLARRQSVVEIDLTQSQAILGSPAFMAPEQVEARQDEIGPATDVYALGIILFEAVTGQRPFTGSLASIFGQIVSSEAVAPSTLHVNLPPAIDAICLKAIAKSPADRHATAAAFADELKRFLNDPNDHSPTVQLQPAKENPTPSADDAAVGQSTDSGDNSISRLQREAELRSVTVAVFAFEADESSLSSALASQSELMHDQAKSFAAFVDERIKQFGGVTVQSSGEEVITCFGFPQAFEDAAQRAVRASLQILRDLGQDENQPAPQNPKLPASYQTCASIHSGEAVAESVNRASGEEYSLVGEARNAATKLSALAEPGKVVISPATNQRVKLFFECESLGEQNVRGMGKVELFEVTKEAVSRNRVDLVDPGNLTPLVGRDTELTILKDRWEQALDELGQVVLLTGDAGLGKSRLIRELREHVISEDEDDTAVIELRCSQYHQNAAYFPLIEYLSRLLEFEHQSPQERLMDVARYLTALKMGTDENISLLCTMLGVPADEQYPPLELPPQKIKELTEELLLNWLKQLVSLSPVLFIVEDLHWVDPSTVAIIERHVEMFESGRTLTLLTFRPEFEPPWKNRSGQTVIALNRLTKRQIGQMIKKRTNQSEIPDIILQQVIDRTEGIPLFIEEFSNIIVESGMLNETDSGDSFAQLNVIPATLHDLLLSRLDRMGANREVIQLAATIGREFSFELLKAACPWPEADLLAELDKLVHSEIIFQRGKETEASYIFKHALLQDAAYGAMLSKKRRACHQQIAEALETQFTEVAEAQPALLAQHFTEGGDSQKAVQYWLKAGQEAQQGSNNTEAISNLTRGLEVLAAIDESPEREQLELGFQLTLAPVLMAARGWSAPEVGTAIERAQQLVAKHGAVEDQFFVMWGLWGWRLIRADMDISAGIADDIMKLVEASPAGGELLSEANWVIGATAYYKGDIKTSLELFEKGLALVDDEKERAWSLKTGQRCSLMCRSHSALALWQLGFPDQALQRAEETIRLGKELQHPFTFAMGLFFNRQVLEFCGLHEQSLARIEEEYTICDENGFVFFEVHAIFGRGVSLLKQGKVDEAREQFDLGLVMLKATGGNLSMDHPYRNIAEAYLLAGLPDDAKEWLDRGFDLVNNRHERGMESEFLRLRGAMALAAGDEKSAEENYQQALEVARQQHAKSWELRAMINFAEMRQHQGKNDEAREMLESTYSFFTEGFDTSDLVRAKSLLNDLGAQV